MAYRLRTNYSEDEYIQGIADTNLVGGDLVCTTVSAGGITMLTKAQNNDTSKLAQGIMLQDYTAGSGAVAYKKATITDYTGLTANSRYYLDHAGGITSTLPIAGLRVQLLGIATNTTTLKIICDPTPLVTQALANTILTVA